MGEELKRWPLWAERSLQGLAFWIGHRHALYRGHPLAEGALVAEACNLIYANLQPGEVLLCEEQYSRLVPPDRWPLYLGRRSRADLVIVNGINRVQAAEAASLLPHATVVIEVKRATASTAQIDDDLKRLATLKAANQSVRALLFLVSEAKRPARFVSVEGRAILGKHNIPTTACHYRVRRACKAASAFSGMNSAHYACIIEIFN
ncbi:MAG TPA: hypothetical protein VGJ21_20465 [Terracidiphilus sp.]|jgi:hypothetical protein